MRNTLPKTMVAGVAALSLAASVLATTEPASAAFRYGGGGFGWHGGGWHGGGWGACSGQRSKHIAQLTTPYSPSFRAG